VLSTAQRRRNPAPLSYDQTPLHVIVLSGGVGPERVVSLTSGREVAQALEDQGHRVENWVIDTDDPAALDALPREADVVFIALHGEYGEDGRVQRALAQRGFAYTGSGPQASATAFDKLRTKLVLERAGVPLADHVVLPFPAAPRDLAHALRTAPRGMTVVKPVRMGSSVGVRICNGRGQLERAIAENQRYKQPQLIEEFVPGHELTVGILGTQALPVVEPVPRLGTYDFQAKYDPSAGTDYRVDPEGIPFAVRTRAQEVSLLAHSALGCSDVSRVDLRYDPKADRLIVLEVNTIPGMTPTSLLPKGAEAVGVAFGQLVDTLCRLAIGARA